MDIQRPDLQRKARLRRRLQLTVAGAVLLLLVMIVAGMQPAMPRVPRAEAWLDTVQRGELVREVRAPGSLQPRELRWIAAETAGRVERILVRPGARVSADTVVLELVNPELIEQQLAAEAALKAAEAELVAREISLGAQLIDHRAELERAQSEYESARLQAEAERQLAESGILSRIQAQRSALAAEQWQRRVELERQRIANFERTLRAQLEAERARLQQTAGTAELRRQQVAALQVRAGIDGVLQQIAVEEGQQVSAGSNLLRVSRPDQLIAVLRVPETQIGEVALDQRVRIDLRGTEVEGRILRIDPAVSNGAVQVDVAFEAPLPSGARPDLSVDGVIEIERLSDVLYVGRPAYGQEGAEVPLFRVDEARGIAERVRVRLGRASLGKIEVLAGLEAGDRVLLSDTTPWNEHERIRIE